MKITCKTHTFSNSQLSNYKVKKVGKQVEKQLVEVKLNFYLPSIFLPFPFSFS